MPYNALDNQSAVAYLKKLGALASFWGEQPDLTAEEIGDGNLNQVFVVTEKSSGKKLVLKQALPYLRVAGESWPLTRERMTFETRALLYYGEVTPDLVPEVYHHSEEMSLVVMAYLGDLEVMRGPLTKGQRFETFADDIARFMARTHFYSSDAFLSGPDKKAKQQSFINPQLCKLQEDFVFTNPFMTSEENRWNPVLESEVQALRQDAALKLAINQTKQGYMTHAQALLHGDLHTGSIMVNADSLKIIDPEFAFYGPQGYDVGTLFANLVLAALTQVHHTPDTKKREAYQVYLLELIPTIWERYARTFNKLWLEQNEGDLSPPAYWTFDKGEEAFAQFRKDYLRSVLTDAARHGGCELLRRLMGIVSIYELSSVPDEEVRAVAERQAVEVARAWLTKPIESATALAGVTKRVIDLKRASL